MRCSQCGAESPAEAIFCIACGANVRPMAATPPRVSKPPAHDPVAGAQTIVPHGMRADSLSAGERIGPDGRYEVVRFLGQGGMGAVYEASDLQLGEAVAIKVLLPSLLESEAARSRLLREARAARSLSHPRIVKVFGVEQHEGFTFIVMELLDPTTLRDELVRQRAEGRTMPLADIVSLTRDACEALGHAHATGLLHRDIKPDNIVVQRDGSGLHAKLLDFGIAAAIDPQLRTSTRSAQGTAGYIAPEVLMSGVAELASDIYSFGVVLHECLTGVIPVGRTEPASTLRAGISPRWDALFDRVLAGDPAKRPRSASELLALVVEAAAEPARPAPAASGTRAGGERQGSPTRQAQRPAPVRSSRATAWIAVGLGALVIAAGGWWKFRPDAESPKSPETAAVAAPGAAPQDPLPPVVAPQASPAMATAPSAPEPAYSPIADLLESAGNAERQGQLFTGETSALAYFRRVLELQPDNEAASLGIGRLQHLKMEEGRRLEAAGDLEGARGSYEQASQIRADEVVHIALDRIAAAALAPEPAAQGLLSAPSEAAQVSPIEPPPQAVSSPPPGSSSGLLEVGLLALNISQGTYRANQYSSGPGDPVARAEVTLRLVNASGLPMAIAHQKGERAALAGGNSDWSFEAISGVGIVSRGQQPETELLAGGAVTVTWRFRGEPGMKAGPFSFTTSLSGQRRGESILVPVSQTAMIPGAGPEPQAMLRPASQAPVAASLVSLDLRQGTYQANQYSSGKGAPVTRADVSLRLENVSGEDIRLSHPSRTEVLLSGGTSSWIHEEVAGVGAVSPGQSPTTLVPAGSSLVVTWTFRGAPHVDTGTYALTAVLAYERPGFSGFVSVGEAGMRPR